MYSLFTVRSTEEFFSMQAQSFGFLRVEADGAAASPFAFTHRDFLDFEILGDGVISSGAYPVWGDPHRGVASEYPGYHPENRS
jgi:hypothetical protein